MAFTASLGKEKRFTEVVYQGKIITSEVERALTARNRLAHKHDIKHHLIDCCQVEEIPGLPDLYWIAGKIRKILDFPIHKAAMVLPKSEEIGINLLYFTIKARHHGVDIEMFNNRQSAVEWLCEA